MFKDDDGGYRDWLARHQGTDSFVLNAERNPKATYLILHRATCHTISGEPARGAQWTHDFIKVCGTRAELEAFARTVEGTPQLCGH
ncbi:hypothetical protein, partial [Bradyrhizobium sp. NBAIM08]|uniref:hypothetical protein n=1 Tax=Bradyrhizobium sp. NBAIM08 TaxID=2793815 RepID=UPI001CD72CB2